jgi:TPR repeat protein
MGYCFESGRGVQKDEEESVKWFRKAAEQNNANAQLGLANAYLRGTSLPKNEAEAVKWYRKAADQNIIRAQYNLAIIFAYGSVDLRDFPEAYKWMLIAVANGDQNAKSSIQDMEKLLKPEQIAEGQKRSKEFLSLHPKSNNDSSPR